MAMSDPKQAIPDGVRYGKHTDNSPDGLSKIHLAEGLDWNLLKTFLEITKAQGVSEAARRLHRGQPAVSLALKRLEDCLGVRLCERGAKGFNLSEEGAQLADICMSISRMVDDIPIRIGNSAYVVAGKLQIMLVCNVVDSNLDTVIERFHTKYPGVEIVLEVGTWDVIGRAILKNQIDVGVSPVRFTDTNLRYDLLFREVHRIYCGRSHPLFGRRIDDPHDLASEAFILTSVDGDDELTKYRLKFGLARQLSGEATHLEEAKRLATLGIGLCFLPEGYAQPDVEQGRLWPLLTTRDTPSTNVFIVTNSKAPPHIARRLFLDELRQQLTESPESNSANE